MDVDLPDSPYRMWIDGTLGDYVPLPDGYRVEIVGGDMVISPGAPLSHNFIIHAFVEAAAVRRSIEPSYRIAAMGTTGFDLEPIQEAYIPDILLLDYDHLLDIMNEGVRYVRPSDILMAVEITSRTNARIDRAPGPQLVRADGTYPKSKWTGYARCGVPFYLVVDCDKQVGQVLLYSVPDLDAGTYLEVEKWPLGEPIRLPEPINLTIPTDKWQTWGN